MGKKQVQRIKVRGREQVSGRRQVTARVATDGDSPRVLNSKYTNGPTGGCVLAPLTHYPNFPSSLLPSSPSLFLFLSLPLSSSLLSLFSVVSFQLFSLSSSELIGF